MVHTQKKNLKKPQKTKLQQPSFAHLLLSSQFCGVRVNALLVGVGACGGGGGGGVYFGTS